jgi:hypothetical protein
VSVRYNRGCIGALMQDEVAARHYLEEAAAAAAAHGGEGALLSAAELREDPDLAALHGVGWFEALVAALP